MLYSWFIVSGLAWNLVRVIVFGACGGLVASLVVSYDRLYSVC